jgi:hypothetical protein
MPDYSQLLGGLGVVGILAAVLLGMVVLFVLPFWAIIDCLVSRRENGAKAVLIVLLVMTWGMGSIVYGLLFPGTRALRIFTVLAIVLPVLILVPSVVSLITGASMAGKLQMEQERAETAKLVADFVPDELSPDAIEPFVAVHYVHGTGSPVSAALARLTLGGPESGSARDIDNQVRHVAHDRAHDRYFALTRHDFGTITPSSGRFTKIEVDPSLGDFSWPKGLAYDSKRKQIIVMTSHVYTRFYRYDPRTADWERLPAEHRDGSLAGMTYSPEEDCLYALVQESRETALRQIHRFNTSGALLGSITLSPPIPVSRTTDGSYQLHHSSGMLLLVLPPREPSAGAEMPRILAVDPSDGRVLTASDTTTVALRHGSG